MRNNNQTVIKKITGKSLMTNKRRNFFIIMAIILTTFMIASVISIGMSYNKSMETEMLKYAQAQESGEGANIVYSMGNPESPVTFIVYALIILFLMFVGYLLIYNVLYISISNDVRFYGLLKTIGTTPKQIYKIVIGQVLSLCAVAIPIGLLSAALLSTVLIPFVLVVESETLISFSPFIYFGAALFSLTTAFIGAASPVKKASSISPVEAVKYTGEHVKINNVKRSARGKPYRMAVRNIFRNKKRAAIVFLNLFLGLSIFVIISTIVFSMDADKYADTYIDGDFFILSQAGLPDAIRFDEHFLREIETIPGFKDMQINTREIGIMKYTEAFDAYLETKINSGYGDPELLRQYFKESFYSRICGIDKTILIALNKSLSEPIDADAFERGEFALIATNNPALFDNIGNIEIMCISSEKTFNIPIGGFAPDFYKWTSDMNAPTVFVSNMFLKQYADDPLIVSVDVNVDEKYGMQALSAMRNIVDSNKELLLISRIEERQVVQNAKTILYTLGGAVSVILGMIGILNFINVMSVGILARKREIAALESVGMSRKQVRKMLVCEGMGYTAVTLLLVLFFGNAFAVGIYMLFEYAQNQSGFSLFTFSYPFIPVIITCVIIFIICVITPLMIYRSINQTSVVERLREAE